MYFDKFDKIYYDFEIKGKRQLHIITDITRNVRFRKEILANVTLYDEYDIKDGETPEMIAEKIYGNPKYHWVIMLSNECYNYLDNFPLSTRNLESYIKHKYNAINFLKDTNSKNIYNPLVGIASAPTWSYSGSNVTISAVGQLSHYQLQVGDTIVVNNLKVYDIITSDGLIVASNPPNGTFTITGVNGDTITFNSGKIITGTAGGFEFMELSTTNREYDIHHYVDSNGYVVDSSNPTATSVSNYLHEDIVNESKRRIKIVSPALIGLVLKNISEL